MKHVYADADKKNMLNTIVYLNFEDDHIYKNCSIRKGYAPQSSDYTEPLTYEEAEKLFLEGMLLATYTSDTWRFYSPCTLITADEDSDEEDKYAKLEYVDYLGQISEATTIPASDIDN